MNLSVKRVADVVWWLLVSIVLFFASIMLLVKFSLPYADEYRYQIERNLSQVSGYEIGIENISAKLEGLDPSFSIDGLSLKVEGESQPLRFERLMIRLNLWQSLIKFEPNFSYIRLYQTQVSLSEQSGHWSLTGLPVVASQNTGGFTRIFNYFLDQRQISLIGTQVSIQSERVGIINLSSDAMYLQRTASGIGVSANVQHQNYDEEFKLNAEIQGDLSRPKSLKFIAELDLPEMSFSKTELIELEKLQLSQLDFGAKLWVSYSSGSGFSVVGDLNLQPKLFTGEVLSFSSKLNSQYSLNTRKLSLQLVDLVINRDNVLFPAANIKIDKDFKLGVTEVVFDRLDLGLGIDLAIPYLKKSWFVTKMLSAMQAQGVAENGHLKIIEAPELSVTYEGNLFIESADGYQNIPKAERLEAILTIDNDQGSIGFASNNASLAFPLMYQDAWQLDGVVGHVAWGSQQDSFLVSANNLYLSRNGADLTGDFRLEVVQNGNDTLALDIHGENLVMSDGLAYIPDSVLPESANEWLNESLIEGRAKQADFVLQTELSKGASPQFLVNLDVDSVKVKFASDWPIAKKVDAAVYIDDAGVELELNYAALADVESRDLSLSIPFIEGGIGPLSLEGRLTDDLGDVMSLLAQTDLATNALKPFQSWHAKGVAKGEFKLMLPLVSEHKEAPHFNLALRLKDNLLQITDLELSGKVLEGVLNYDTKKGIYNSNFDIEAFSGATKLNLYGDVLPSGDLLVRADIKGDLDLEEVMAWQKLPKMLTKAVQGEVDFTADFTINPDLPALINVNAETNLKGASLSLPVPFAKTTNTQKPLALSIDVLSDYADVSILYDGNYRSKLRFSESGFYGGQVLINNANESDFEVSSGLSLKGQLPHVELAAWRKFLNEPDDTNTSSPQNLRLFVPEWLSFVNLIVDQVRLNEDNLLHNVKVQYDISKRPSDIYLNSEEMSLQLTKDLQGPVVNFSYLSWNSPAKDDKQGIEVDAAKVADSAVIKAQQIPTMSLNINELVVNNQPYGDWQLMITNLGKKIRIDPFSTELTEGDFVGSLFWQDDEHSNVEFLLNVDGGDIDELTRKFSNQTLLTSKEYKINVSLSWLGTPFDIQRDTLTGRIEFLSKNGVLEKVNELPSFLKALGIFNLHALARRLTLDFSDVSSDGLTYDKMSTSLVIQNGQLNTSKPLSIVSPTVEIELQGNADLVTETLDERMIAYFPLGNALPIAGFLLGMPQVAGILYITDKIFGDKLSKVTSVEYLIKGPFADPIITPVVHTPKVRPKNRDK
ncbi:YhdP family phospholipid transporter [Marinomonas sp. PE14-40]|uniref:YhdP family phospholipid transporter n=1 Tax=Marinomonas sp. PE14-40 TaxID=3060621 RepID=UPI003F672989